ncbi:hypothetical protein [Staphylococcus succinus]|uniref:hypothetical protein n=1 Tax=Staphylococcus succinus TaxID=61015 RepID=UPI001299DAD5|nr:hypothetical protein [Staphylococcus succinus]MBU0437025.1 hypothetical protein [Staphylococcus succinus]MRF37141.1 hypothetical protein [Staphylococcus sp. KY49P]
MELFINILIIVVLFSLILFNVIPTFTRKYRYENKIKISIDSKNKVVFIVPGKKVTKDRIEDTVDTYEYIGVYEVVVVDSKDNIFSV